MDSQQLDEITDEVIIIKEKKKSKGPANKRKGSRVEREYANLFKNLDDSLKQCKTTRFTSRILDNCKIDLNFLPILVQIKAGEQKGLKVSEVLEEMSQELAKNLPANYPEHTMPKIVIHHKDMPKGQRTRKPVDTMVHLTFDDFLKLFLAFVNQQKHDIQTKQPAS